MSTQKTISSFAPLGIPTFPVPSGLQYLHDMEELIEQQGRFAIPSAAGPYGAPPDTGWLVADGPPWMSAEATVLARLIEAIREVRPGKYSDALRPEIVRPYAFPMMYVDSRNKREPAHGCWMARRKAIYVLRRYMLYRWPLMMHVLFHEGVHSVEDHDAACTKSERESELSAHGESLAFADAALAWCTHLTGDPSLVGWVRTLFSQLKVAEQSTLAILAKP